MTVLRWGSIKGVRDDMTVHDEGQYTFYPIQLEQARDMCLLGLRIVVLAVSILRI